MSVKQLTEHHFEFLGLTGGCTGLSESTLVKMPHCWKSHVTAPLWFCENMYIDDMDGEKEFPLTQYSLAKLSRVIFNILYRVPRGKMVPQRSSIFIFKKSQFLKLIFL